MDMNELISLYGSNTFNDEVMKERLPFSTYKEFHDSLEKGETLSKECASVIANAMKIWALEKGATHFTHWFTPLNGRSAEKHDAFLLPEKDKAILDFNGKLLRKGEPDASSFPTGGLRATFEARGYTSWDCTSPAFVKDGSLYIPTLFCSYNGESLDDKTPLLKSCDCLSKIATNLLNLLGYKEVNKVTPYVGGEQEYFLIKEELFQKRLDLKLTGRTLFGAPPSKAQEMNDHYFASIDKNVSSFMKELDRELWKFQIPSKTKHNEVAPCQHEIACVYTKANIACDNNNLLMSLMQEIAKNHGLRCLLHEKPFNKLNGSGKHNNWSLMTNNGINLFNPGKEPSNNLAFLASLSCLIKGIDEYQDLLRLSIATASNDRRLGGYEAPPFIISIFLGNEINDIIDSIILNKQIRKDDNVRFKTGVKVIPDFKKDHTDRNRTSPFAFTGNKFEFRGVGSSLSLAFINTILNAIIAFEMKEMTDEIQKGNKPLDVIRKFFLEHRRIIFEGDSYSLKWKEEAKNRGLLNITNCVDAFKCLKEKRIIELFESLGIYSEVELNSRYQIMLNNYSNTIKVEASTSIKMARNQIYPSSIRYLNELLETSNNLKKNNIDNIFLLEQIKELSILLSKMYNDVNLLEESLEKVEQIKDDSFKKASFFKDEVIKNMDSLREIVDLVETKVDKSLWPLPTYSDLLFDM